MKEIRKAAIKAREPVLSDIEPTSSVSGQAQTVDKPEPFDLNDALGAGLDRADMLALDAHLAASYFHDLQAERDALKTELYIAVGMLSTQPDYSGEHPMDVLQIVKDVAIDAAREENINAGGKS